MMHHLCRHANAFGHYERSDILPLDSFGWKDGKPFRRQLDGTYLWFVYAGAASELADAELVAALKEALCIAHSFKAKEVVTNGVGAVAVGNNAQDARTDFLINYASTKESQDESFNELVSMSDIFAKRNLKSNFEKLLENDSG